MDKIKNLGITIAEKFNVIVERAKTDKKFLAALIGVAVAVVAIIVAIVIALSGGESQGNGGGLVDTGSGEKMTYTVTVETKGGMVLADIDVNVYKDQKLTDLQDVGTVDEEGKVEFELPESDNYFIEVNAPNGYEVEEYYKFDGKEAKIVLTSAVINEDINNAQTLGVGDVMYDFTITTPDGEKYVLSELLKEKKMVMLNFWYTSCSWCVKEFPVMAEVYGQYKDEIEILAVDPMGEGNDAVKSFKTQNNLPFPMAEVPTSWASVFGVQGYPTTVLIDQYGVICCVESGAITSLRPFVSAFEHFTADDYKQQLCVNGIGDLVTQIKPTYEMPKSDEIAAAINGGNINVTYRPEDGDAAEFTWPFVIGEKDGSKCIYASNKGIEDSYAILYADVELKKGQAIAFDYIVSCESGNDSLVVIVDNEDIYQITGVDENPTWKTCYPWVAEEDGTYELALCFLKDESTNEGDDTAYVKNLRVVDASAVDVETYLPRYAATEKEDGSFSYVNIVYNPADGYYHVGTANGPLLLADLLNYTQFNEENTVYQLVYEDGKFEVDGVDRFKELEQYANYASNARRLTGMCPVTKDLAVLLQAFAEKYGFEDDDNEWLKLCKYYAAYGTSKQLEDPIKGLATFSAYKAQLGSDNSFYYDRAILPRGMMAEFIPSKSGVYRITSSNDSQQGVDAWIFDENRKELLVYEPDERMFQEEGEVSMVFYMEAGKKYYIDIAFWDVYEVGTINYKIEYIAPTYNLFRLASPGYFTYDSNATGDAMYYVIAGGIDVVLGEDGIYYEDLGNGKKGSKLYCDFTGITGIFSNPIMTNQGVKGMIDMGGFDFSKTENDMYVLSIIEAQGSVEAADKYLKELWGEDYDGYAEEYQLKDVFAGKYHGTGKDYTEEMRAYCAQVDKSSNTERNGCVVVTKELAEILQMVMEKYTFENVDHAWTKLCYYYDYLGPAN